MKVIPPLLFSVLILINQSHRHEQTEFDLFTKAFLLPSMPKNSKLNLNAVATSKLSRCLNTISFSDISKYSKGLT